MSVFQCEVIFLYLDKDSASICVTSNFYSHFGLVALYFKGVSQKTLTKMTQENLTANFLSLTLYELFIQDG